jgi:hypothetical protein
MMAGQMPAKIDPGMISGIIDFLSWCPQNRKHDMGY